MSNIEPIIESHNKSSLVPAQVHLPSYATVGEVESVLDNFFKNAQANPAALELDMSNCKFVEAATLLLIIALISSRERKTLSTTIRLPLSKDVRDFFRIWEFPKAIHDAVGRSFSSVVCSEDHRYFGENAASLDKLKYKGLVVIVDGGRERLLSQVFYGIRSFFAKQVTFSDSLAKKESKDWKEEQVIWVLNKHLEGRGKRISSHIIHESMMNALRHPRAGIIQTTSHFVQPHEGSKNQKGHLTIVFWDDGQSIVDTLRDAITEGKQIRSVDVPRLYANYEYIAEDENGVKSDPRTVCSDSIPDKHTEDGLLLLSATFPGITRDVAGLGHDFDADLLSEDEVFAMPGMGLYVMTNTAVDVFGGSVSIRTKNYFMNIKPIANRAGDNKLRYRVKVRQFGEWVPPFLGNMLTIRLPLG